MLLGNGLGFWKTMPIRRRGGDRVGLRGRCGLAVEVDLATIRRPGIRSFIRLKQRRSVVLPQPEGPIKAVILFPGDVDADVLAARDNPYQTERHSS